MEIRFLIVKTGKINCKVTGTEKKGDNYYKRVEFLDRSKLIASFWTINLYYITTLKGSFFTYDWELPNVVEINFVKKYGEWNLNRDQYYKDVGIESFFGLYLCS